MHNVALHDKGDKYNYNYTAGFIINGNHHFGKNKL